MKAVCTFYGDDLNKVLLHAQLSTFGLHFRQIQAENKKSTENLTIFDIKDYFLSLSQGQQTLLCEVKKVLQLILVMLATNATSERSFSTLLALYGLL